ncbi:hypothetical protein C8Q78DRAFT_1072372 [Trametes maxima]|nr:hypothetical protein C8Q78DRAFT_1072372 [Trametes maxima]
MASISITLRSFFLLQFVFFLGLVAGPSSAWASSLHRVPRVTTSKLSVGNGVDLAFIDSGAPTSYSKSTPYTTIFAIHGEGYYSPVFQKIVAYAPLANIRFVAVTRRDYNGSTALTTDQINVLASGTDAQKASYLVDRSTEIATFIDTFVTKNSIPAPTSNGKYGGFAILGWSLGNAFAISTVSNVQSYSSAIQTRFSTYLRALILQEPPSVAIGTGPLPPQTYTPQIDTSIPAELQQPAFIQWITAYFDHGDISSKDPNVLSYVLPSISRPPSVFNMSVAQLAGMTNNGPANGSDGLLIANVQAQLLASYKKALYDNATRAAVPKMKVTEIVGDATAEFGIVAYWSMLDDNAAAGGNKVQFKVLHGANHFVHWDNPEIAIATYAASLQ